MQPPPAIERQKHKLRRLVESPNSYFMDIKCHVCSVITTAFSHSQTTIRCRNCGAVVCSPTGGKARITEGCSFRRKSG